MFNIKEIRILHSNHDIRIKSINGLLKYLSKYFSIGLNK